MFFGTGSFNELNWPNFTFDYPKQVGLMKEKYDHRLLLKHLPSELRQFLEHVQGLEYADAPDYGMLAALLERCCKRRGIRDTDPYDWEKDVSLTFRQDIFSLF